MSILFRRGGSPERRAISYQDVWGRGLDFHTGATKSGVTVTPSGSLRLPAVWSSVMLLANVVSTMPVDVYRSSTGRAPVSPVPGVVGAPSLLVSRREWVFQAMMSLLLRGNAYGLVVERDGALRPRSVEWLDPDAVTVTQESSLSRPVYAIGGHTLPFDDVVHMRAFLKAGSAVGMSPIEHHRETVGVGLGAQAFGAQWFGDGGHPTAIFKNTAREVPQPVADAFKTNFLAKVKGKREPLVVGSDWSYEQIQVKPNESQFLEAMGYTDAQVARIFGPGVAEVLGYETGGSMTYSNREQRTLDLLTFAVQPWIVRFEDMWTAMVPRPQYVKLNTDSLLRSDTKTRWEVHRIRREIGAANVDEIREIEDQGPLPGGQGQDYSPLKTTTGGRSDVVPS